MADKQYTIHYERMVTSTLPIYAANVDDVIAKSKNVDQLNWIEQDFLDVNQKPSAWQPVRIVDENGRTVWFLGLTEGGEVTR